MGKRINILWITVFCIVYAVRISRGVEQRNVLRFLRRKSFIYLIGKNDTSVDLQRQNIIQSTKIPSSVAWITKTSQSARRNSALPTTKKPSITSGYTMVTIRKPTVTLPKLLSTKQTALPTKIATTVKDSHVKIPEPIDVIPVQVIPTQRFLPTPTSSTSNVNDANANKTHLLLPNLPVYNVSAKNAGVEPVIMGENVPTQTQMKGESDPIEPLPVMTRPTVTVLQHVIGTGPTQATLQSIVVPRRKHTSPLSPITPLPVLEPHTVATPMRLLKPIPPQEPHVIHHIPIVVPKDCNDTDPCGCQDNCSGK